MSAGKCPSLMCNVSECPLPPSSGFVPSVGSSQRAEWRGLALPRTQPLWPRPSAGDSADRLWEVIERVLVPTALTGWDVCTKCVSGSESIRLMIFDKWLHYLYHSTRTCFYFHLVSLNHILIHCAKLALYCPVMRAEISTSQTSFFFLLSKQARFFGEWQTGAAGKV